MYFTPGQHCTVIRNVNDMPCSLSVSCLNPRSPLLRRRLLSRLGRLSLSLELGLLSPDLFRDTRRLARDTLDLRRGRNVLKLGTEVDAAQREVLALRDWPAVDDRDVVSDAALCVGSAVTTHGMTAGMAVGAVDRVASNSEQHAGARAEAASRMPGIADAARL